MSGWGAWGGPRAAYELTAAIVLGDRAAAGMLLQDLDPREAWEMVVALGAQARQAAELAAGHRAGHVRLQQQQEALAELLCSPAMRVAMDALRAVPAEAPDPMPPASALAEAAQCLARIAARTTTEAGWPPVLVATLCRRAAAL